MESNVGGGPWIAALCIVSAVGLSVYLFSASRLDPGLRMAALVHITSIASALMATASTLLVGKVFGPSAPNTDPNSLPPGSVVSSTSVDRVQTPPITPPTPPV